MYPLKQANTRISIYCNHVLRETATLAWTIRSSKLLSVSIARSSSRVRGLIHDFQRIDAPNKWPTELSINSGVNTDASGTKTTRCVLPFLGGGAKFSKGASSVEGAPMLWYTASSQLYHKIILNQQLRYSQPPKGSKLTLYFVQKPTNFY